MTRKNRHILAGAVSGGRPLVRPHVYGERLPLRCLLLDEPIGVPGGASRVLNLDGESKDTLNKSVDYGGIVP